MGRRRGGLSAVHPVDLSAELLTGLLARIALDPSHIDDVLWGCVTQVGEQSWNVGRNVALAAGWPEEVPGATIDRQCGSSQQAIHFAAAVVASGQADVVVAGGVESMSRVPLGANAAGPGAPFGPRLLQRYREQIVDEAVPFHQGRSAEMIAARWQLSRPVLDEFSFSSHQRAIAAMDAGAFDSEIVAVSPGADAAAAGPLTRDEGPRRDSSVAALAALPPAFVADGVITAGSSSQISDGAAAVVVTTSDIARDVGIAPLARIHTAVVVASDPMLMLTAPIPATERALQRAELRLDEIGVYEVNEAFASVPLAWLTETGAAPDRLNPRGGAIALGHPLGASGARLATTLLHYMADHGIRYGLQTMCEGGGMANATIYELL